MTSTTTGTEVLKQDSRGRVRVPRERREALLAEFEQSRLSGSEVRGAGRDQVSDVCHLGAATGQVEIVGQSARSCADRIGVCYNDLVKLLNGHKIMIRGWALEQTMKLAQVHC